MGLSCPGKARLPMEKGGLQGRQTPAWVQGRERATHLTSWGSARPCALPRIQARKGRRWCSGPVQPQTSCPELRPLLNASSCHSASGSDVLSTLWMEETLQGFFLAVGSQHPQLNFQKKTILPRPFPQQHLMKCFPTCGRWRHLPAIAP